MKISTLECVFCIALPLMVAAPAMGASDGLGSLVVTASNATSNQLLVYTAGGGLVQTISTQGQGGAGGNAGGIAASDELVAVVNFGSKNVSLFTHNGNSFHMSQLVPAASSPLSVAIGNGHLYILGASKIESHRLFGFIASPNPDGLATLLKADGSAAQVGLLPNQLIISEKSNAIETVNLSGDGAVAGTPVLVTNIPANVDAPFGLITRGDNAYVTIAHADEISLVRGGKVLTTTPSVTQHAPCWLALAGPFLFSANTASKSISRYAVYGQKIVQDLAVAATVGGSPADIAAAAGLVAVVDGTTGAPSHLSIFTTDEDGNLFLKSTSALPAGANGVAIVHSQIGRHDD